jgi:hypothetical protein
MFRGIVTFPVYLKPKRSLWTLSHSTIHWNSRISFPVCIIFIHSEKPQTALDFFALEIWFYGVWLRHSRISKVRGWLATRFSASSDHFFSSHSRSCIYKICIRASEAAPKDRVKQVEEQVVSWFWQAHCSRTAELCSGLRLRRLTFYPRW